ncbi:MAG: hypothetical protein HYY92_00250 [Parcubacteria group bacterium]|nr:hypothetical protein [Parcubacteria group bacterium]
MCFVSYGEETKSKGSALILALGVVLLAIATLLGGLVFNTAGLGKIAEEYKAGDHIWSNRTLEENVPYFITNTVKVRDDEHIAFVCEVKKVDAGHTTPYYAVTSCADTHDWRAYRFKTPPPELFIKRKDGVIQKITLEEARLLKEVEK